MSEHQAASYKNLIVYQKAESLTVDAIKYFSKQKVNKTQEFLITQLLRSLGSIGANIAEGYGRHYKKSYRHFLSIARGSSFEAEYWLEVAIKIKKFNNNILEDFRKVNNEIIKMLTSMMKKMERKKQT
ncbi:MAG: four helix bundle protein [Candidatus Bathyarchaeota archaeon]|nr:four helix bundle protein [Candidatus Bathyarchaeota archaeon]